MTPFAQPHVDAAPARRAAVALHALAMAAAVCLVASLLVVVARALASGDVALAPRVMVPL